MAAAAPPSDEECPVCHDDFTDPKILPCTHLVCRKCVLSWLHKGGNQAGCPLCRASILPQVASIQDVAALVDDLPTDIITKAAVESRKILNEKHVCVCDGTTKATSLCMQCRIKFCPGCVKAHKMIPATREHEIKQIATLTVDKLAASYQSSCAVHPGRQVEQFCSSHQELICLNCSTSTHRRCPDVEGIAGAAMVKRQRLKKQEKELEGKRGEIQTQVCQLDIAAADGLAKFKAMKDKVKSTFDELRGILDKRCRDATAEIQKKEDEFLKENKSQKSDLEKLRARSAALCSTVSRLASASDDPLLAMLVKLKSRLEDAELLSRHNDVVRQEVSAAGIGDFFFDPQSSARLKKRIAKHGQMRDPKQPQQPFMGKTQIGYARLQGGSPLSAQQDRHLSSPQQQVRQELSAAYERKDLKLAPPSLQSQRREQALEDLQKTVMVTGAALKEEDEEICHLYFENEKRSGGGEIGKDCLWWDEKRKCFFITFIDSQVAKRVAAREHALKSYPVQVEVCSSPPTPRAEAALTPEGRPLQTQARVKNRHLPSQPGRRSVTSTNAASEYRVKVSGVPSGTSADCLQNYLECVSDISVKSITLSKDRNSAVVIMSSSGDELDLPSMNSVCVESPLEEGSLMSFVKVSSSPSSVIRVTGLKPKTADEAVQFFFSNKRRNKGGPVKRVERSQDKTSALIHFIKHEDAEAVVKKDHTLDSNPLHVTLHDEADSENESDKSERRRSVSSEDRESFRRDEPSSDDEYAADQEGKAAQFSKGGLASRDGEYARGNTDFSLSDRHQESAMSSDKNKDQYCSSAGKLLFGKRLEEKDTPTSASPRGKHSGGSSHKPTTERTERGSVTKCYITTDGGGARASQSGGRVLAKAQLSPTLDLQIIQGDITQCAVDAIINAANGRLKHDGGVAAAIVKAGGRCIQEESDELVAEHGELNDGEVTVTGAGTLPCSHVIHAVGPTWSGGTKGEEEALIQTVKSILKEAEKMKLTSVAIPAISCGIFRYPVDRATSTIMKTIAQFLQRERDLSLQTVVLIDMGADPLRGFISAGKLLFGKRLEEKDTPTSAPPRGKHSGGSSHKPTERTERDAENVAEKGDHYIGGSKLHVTLSLHKETDSETNHGSLDLWGVHPVPAGSVFGLDEGMGYPRRHTDGYPQQEGSRYQEDPSRALKRQTDGYRGLADSGLIDCFRSNQYSSGRNHDSFDCRNLRPTAASSTKTSSETSGTRQKHDTVINLGDRTMRRITGNPVLLRELTTKVKSVGGRFRLKQPDQMIVTCLLDEPTGEWEEAVYAKVNHFLALLPWYERLAAAKLR